MIEHRILNDMEVNLGFIFSLQTLVATQSQLTTELDDLQYTSLNSKLNSRTENLSLPKYHTMFPWQRVKIT